MNIKSTSQQIASIWRALTEMRCHPQIPRRIERQAREIAEAGWAASCTVEDFLFALGLPDWDLCSRPHEYLDLHETTMFERPRVADKDAIGFSYTSAADVAEMAIRYQRLGFDIDPSPLVNLLRPALLKRRLLNQSELHMVWYPSQHEKREPIVLTTPSSPPWGLEKSLKLPTGYKAILDREADGAPIRLEVVAPRYRYRRLAA